MESTVGKSVGCGLQYLPTSVNAVTSQCDLSDFFTRKEGFYIYSLIGLGGLRVFGGECIRFVTNRTANDWENGLNVYR